MIKGALECVFSSPLIIDSRDLSLIFLSRVHSFLSPHSLDRFNHLYPGKRPAEMRSLPIVVLFSMVSLVAAFSNNGHTLRHTHARRCKTKTGGMMNQTDVKQNQTVAYGKQNQTVSDGKQNQTATTGKQNQTVTNGSPYQLVDQYVGADFLDET